MKMNNALAPTRPTHSPPSGATGRTHSPTRPSIYKVYRGVEASGSRGRKATKRKSINGGEWIPPELSLPDIETLERLSHKVTR